MNIGQGIRQLRKSRTPELRQIELAERAGITQSYLSGIENGKKNASVDILKKIANIFEIPLPILFWFTVQESDVSEEKKEFFRFLKPHMDQIIKSIFL